MVDEAIWKRRFFLFLGARLIGFVTFVGGLAIALTDVVREGGWPVAGAIVAILGLIDAVVAPMLMKRQWKADDEAK